MTPPPSNSPNDLPKWQMFTLPASLIPAAIATLKYTVQLSRNYREWADFQQSTTGWVWHDLAPFVVVIGAALIFLVAYGLSFIVLGILSFIFYRLKP